MIRRVDGSTVWERESLQERDWLLVLSHEVREELALSSSALVGAGEDLSMVNAGAARGFTAYSTLAEEVSKRLFHGCGFVVLRGWPVDLVSEDAAALAYWLFAAQLGVTQPQNGSGSRLHVVADRSSKTTGVATGGSVGSNEILLHTENARPPIPPRIIGLLCMQQAQHGGGSVLASGHRLHNVLLDEAPRLVERLYGLFAFGRHKDDTTGGQLTDLSPVFCRTASSIVVRYGRYWLRVAEESTNAMDPGAREAVDAVDEILLRKQLRFECRLARGDALIVNNLAILHGREAFRDRDENAETQRRLLRVWIA